MSKRQFMITIVALCVPCLCFAMRAEAQTPPPECDCTGRALDGSSDNNDTFGTNSIDMLIVYTNAVKSYIEDDPSEGGLGYSSVNAYVGGVLIPYTNVAFSNSLVDAQIDYWFAQLDSSYQVGTTHIAVVHNRLVANGDGDLDDVHVWRNQQAADVVCLLITGSNDGTPLGLTFGMNWQNVGLDFASDAFYVVKVNLGKPEETFAHELGHIMGCDHQDEEDGGVHQDSRGYIQETNQPFFRTIMADSVPGTLTIQHFSNPDVYYPSNGGNPTGDTGFNCAATLNETRSTVSNFRPSCWRDTGGPIDVNSCTDMNQNCIPDTVDTDFGDYTDCDNNGMADELERRYGCASCEDACAHVIPQWRINQCDPNHVDYDEFANCFNDITDCTSVPDCNCNGIPDACEDCNLNGIADICELYQLRSRVDCNGNGILDECDLAQNPNLDCDSNGIIDSCDDGFPDCNNNNIPDICDIMGNGGYLPPTPDCNLNGIPDHCEVGLGCNVAVCKLDFNLDCVPDECQCFSDISPVDPFTQVKGDGIVDILDMMVVLDQWGNGNCAPGCLTCLPSCSTALRCSADLNGDGAVNVLDLQALLADWGPCLIGVPDPYLPEFCNQMIWNTATVSGSESQVGSTTAADDFIVIDTFGGSNSGTINTISWWGFEGCDADNDVVHDSFEITVYETQYDMTIQSQYPYSLISLPSTVVGLRIVSVTNGKLRSALAGISEACSPSGEREAYVYQASFNSGITVTPGTCYWLEIKSNTNIGTGCCNWVWALAKNEGYNVYRAISSNGEVGNYTNEAGNLAFCMDIDWGMPNNLVYEPTCFVAVDCLPQLEDDCDGNGILDYCDLARGTYTDTNLNFIPDCCEDPSCGSTDCNNNSICDICEIEADPGLDVNPANGIPDCCDAVPPNCP